MTTPALDARALVDDERYPAYKASLEERRDKFEAALRRLQEVMLHGKPFDQAQMCLLAGQIRGIEYALGLPEVLLAADPTSESTETPHP